MRNKKTKVINVRPAGKNHQVITISGGKGTSYRRKPCATCPWRKDAVGEFPAEAFRHSADTAYDQAINIFSCHSSGKKKPAICAGFLLSGSVHNIGVRVKLATGIVDMHEVSDGGVEVFESYRAMAEANGVAPDDPVLERCR